MLNGAESGKNVSEYRIVLEEMNDAVFVFNQPGNITDANQIFCEMVGYLKKKIIGKHLGDLLHTGEKNNFVDNFGIFTEKYNSLESVFVSKDGNELKTLTTTFPVRKKGSIDTEILAGIKKIFSYKESQKESSEATEAGVNRTKEESIYAPITVRQRRHGDRRKNATQKLGPSQIIEACLSRSEFRIADLVRRGKTSKEIGSLLCISEKTVETHRRRIRKKLGLTNRKKNLFSHLMSVPSFEIG